MDVRMRYVYMVYKEQSFTRAAEKLYISQPSLSAMVKKVEKEIGAVIFDRSSSPLELTEAGLAYIDHVEELLRSELILEEKLSDIQNLNKGQIRIGGSNYVMTSILPGILQKMLSQYPGIRIELVEENSFILRQMIDNGTLDLVIDSFEATDESLSYEPLFEETILLAVPQESSVDPSFLPYQITVERILSRTYDDLCLPADLANQLLGLPFVLLKAENDMYHRAVQLFSSYEKKPDVRLHLDQLLTALRYASAGIGCTFVTDTLFRFGEKKDQVCLYKLNAENDKRDLRIAHKRGKYISNACKAFIQLAKEHFST